MPPARAATLAAVSLSLVVSGLLYWSLQASRHSGIDDGAVVLAVAPQAAGTAQRVAADTAPGPASAYSAEFPLVEPRVPRSGALGGATAPKPRRLTEEPDSDEVPPTAGETNDEEAEPVQPSPGPLYTWHDGDRVLQVRLDPNLTVQSDGDGITRDDIVTRSDRTAAHGRSAVRSDGTEQRSTESEPVFWSESGQMMALPGGIVLVLDADWDQAAVDEFLRRNGIASSLVTELDFVANGFFIETDPGFPSLNLANSLASQDGVELSSPNWWFERTAS